MAPNKFHVSFDGTSPKNVISDFFPKNMKKSVQQTLGQLFSKMYKIPTKKTPLLLKITSKRKTKIGYK